MMIFNKISSVLFLFLVVAHGSGQGVIDHAGGSQETWAEKLDFPSGKKVIILHADDMGLNNEANKAIIFLMENNLIQSASAMPPCRAFDEAIKWAIDNPDADIGLHLTLTGGSWGPVADPKLVPGLVNPDGHLWRSIEDLVMNATPAEVETELRAQIEKAIKMGYRPKHMDTHRGAIYASNDFTEVYFRLAEEYRIPALVINLSDSTVSNRLKQRGYPITDRLLGLLGDYSMPVLDELTANPHVPKGATYEDMRNNFFERIRSLKPGLTQIFFHPQYESEFVKNISSWQQRAWEVRLFADPVVHEFFENEGLVFTNWKDIMKRFEAKQALAR
jgi:chitin disaccharide deacetylase